MALYCGFLNNLCEIKLRKIDTSDDEFLYNLEHEMRQKECSVDLNKCLIILDKKVEGNHMKDKTFK